MFLIPLSLSAECPNQEIDIAFLIDGSGSIDRADFKRMKDFVRAVMDLSKGTNTQVKTRPSEAWGVGWARVYLWESQPGRLPGITGGWINRPVP